MKGQGHRCIKPQSFRKNHNFEKKKCRKLSPKIYSLKSDKIQITYSQSYGNDARYKRNDLILFISPNDTFVWGMSFSPDSKFKLL